MKNSLSYLMNLILIAILLIPANNYAQTKLIATDDCYVQGGVNATANFSALPATPGDALRVRSSATNQDNVRYSFIKFNLNSLTGTITKAEFQITLDRAVNSTTPSGTVLDRSDLFTAKNDSWTEAAITFNTAPARDKYITSQTFRRRASADPDTTYKWDVTSFVKTEFAGDKFITFVLVDTIAANNTDLRIFSKETVGSEPALFVSIGTDVKTEETLPEDFTVNQNYPNPFNPSTLLSYSLPKDGFVNVSIYNSLGQKVSTLFNGEAAAGNHQINWNGKNHSSVDVASGVYFARITFGNVSRVVKMLLSR